MTSEKCKSCGKRIFYESDTYMEADHILCKNCHCDVETGEYPKEKVTER